MVQKSNPENKIISDYQKEVGAVGRALDWALTYIKTYYPPNDRNQIRAYNAAIKIAESRRIK